MKRDGNNNGIIFQEERLEGILKILEKDGRLVSSELPALFHTTPVTIRKDLILLEERGLLQRTHGGAIKVKKKLFHGQALSEKEKINLEEKLRIVKKAAGMIQDGDTIILDGGSTTSLLAREIRQMENLTVITNALNIAEGLIGTKINVIMVGGRLLMDGSTAVGPLADSVLRKMSADKMFLGVDGIDFKVGITTPNLEEANTSRVMMDISGEIIVVADASKFGRRSLGVISQLNEVDKIITTKQLDEEEIKRINRMDVDVFIV